MYTIAIYLYDLPHVMYSDTVHISHHYHNGRCPYFANT